MAAKKKTKVLSKKSAPRKPAKGTKASAKKKSPAKKVAAKKPASKFAAKPSARKAVGGKKKAPLKAKRPAARAKRPAPKKKVVVAAKSIPNPEGLKIARAIAAAALDKKANDVIIIDTSSEGQLVGYDYIVLASGDSDRQLEAISNAVDDVLRPTGVKPAGTEISPDWVLVDYSDVIAHFFTPDARGQYDFEGRWSHAPRMALS